MSSGCSGGADTVAGVAAVAAGCVSTLGMIVGLAPGCVAPFALKAAAAEADAAPAWAPSPGIAVAPVFSGSASTAAEVDDGGFGLLIKSRPRRTSSAAFCIGLSASRI